ncbi:MAG: hypothetical protein Q8M22_03895 [Actinomycetota bacterium]|nr:hypothetical protein [Actinomycetota bacterium]
MSTWADLRQVVLATTDPVAVAGAMRSQLGLGRGFGDPELEAFGIADDTMAVGEHTFLEVVSPTTADHPIAAWLARRGGSAGYLLSVQVSDIDACLARCERVGVRVTVRHEVQGWHVAQLHPSDMGGSAVELDGLHVRGRWFWDDLDIDRPTSAKVDDVVAVDVAVEDPSAVSARWAEVCGLDVDTAASALALGDRRVRFVAAEDRTGIVAVDVHAVDRDAVGDEFAIGNVRFRLV